ncbi:MAG: membrane protein insertase YidC [Pseudomonadota bacterium]
MDRNFILAMVLMGLILFGYETFIMGPKREAYEAQQREAQALAAEQATQQATQGTSGADVPLAGDNLVLPTVQTELTREEAIAVAPARLRVETPQLTGSINLRGLVFDDLTLTQYNESVEENSPNIILLSPQQTPLAQFMRSGLFINGANDANIIWSAPSGATLTPDTPVTLTRQDGGLTHNVTLSVDDKFMFTLVHEVQNQTGANITVQAYGATAQKDIPQNLENFMILFEGPLAIVGDQLHSRKYKNIQKKGSIIEAGTGGWVGITNKYWLSAVIPDQSQPFKATLGVREGATPLFQSSYQLDPLSIPNGQQAMISSHLFAGAKVVEVLQDYEKPVADGGLGISEFDMAVDWGNFFFLTRPIFASLHFLYGLVGNYGIAILLFTVGIKAILYPLANLSYKSMAGMRKAQPEMQTIRDRYKDDQMKMQQEMMSLYKKHKINPAAGCLPMLAQMPIFYALYKTLFVTLEMRHEPFLYIADLSERDPTSIFNLFGLLPFDPLTVPVIGTFLGIGILPLLMGAGMWVQMKLNPPPTDPLQARIFGLMPLFFLFIFAPFAAGLVLYWAWNTILSVIQQYIIMKRNGADVDLIGNMKDSLGLNKPKTANDNAAGK